MKAAALLFCLFLGVSATEKKKSKEYAMAEELPQFHQVSTGSAGNIALVGDTQEAQLELALEQIKTDIIAKSRDLREELEWVKEVEEIVSSYVIKVERVKVDINATRVEIKGLLKKRRQIENLKLQQELQKRLTDANNDLATIDGALNGVDSKKKAFEQNAADVNVTVAQIQAQLAVLQGNATSSSSTEAAS